MIVLDAGSKSGIRAATAALVLCSIFPACSPCCLCRNTLHKKFPSWTCLSCVLTHVTAHILLSFVSAWCDTPFPQGICHNRTSTALYVWQREKFLKILTVKQGFSLLAFSSPEHTLWLTLRCGDPLPRTWFPHTFIHTDRATFCFHPCSPWPKKSGERLAKIVNKGKNTAPGSLRQTLPFSEASLNNMWNSSGGSSVQKTKHPFDESLCCFPFSSSSLAGILLLTQAPTGRTLGQQQRGLL